MIGAEGLAAEALRIREIRNGEMVVDALESTLRELGVGGFLVSGIPMPGRPVEPLLLRLNWWERHSEGLGAATDPLFAEALRITRPRVVSEPSPEVASGSQLYQTAVSHGAPMLLCIPVRAMQPYQGVVFAAGASFSLDDLELLTIGYLCDEAFRRLFALRAVNPDRPGHLSARERGVVGMSAEGMTASDIAKALAISQRTVHAHLQNASDKLRARNKTQTVIEAIRYGQITL
jgi:LuxR family transcriptional regulator, quorum-sensing system regulator BjaR1